MNYMEQVVKMLGVELGEEFKCSNGFSYKFTNLGLLNANDTCKREEIYDRVLMQILIGNYTIERRPWRPNNDDCYYVIDELGCLSSEKWCNDSIDLNYYKLGNCYRTKEDAEANIDKWIAFYESDEVLEV